MTENSFDELQAKYQTLEVQIEALHKEIEALQQAELAIQQARRNIEEVSTQLVVEQEAVGKEMLEMERRDIPDFPL